MTGSPTPWQWALWLRPEPVSGQGERVLRGPTGAALLGALARAVEPRWRDSFDQELTVEAHRQNDAEGTRGCIRLNLQVARGQLDALSGQVVHAVEQAMAIADAPDAAAEDRTWLFEHAYPGGQGRPPLRLVLQQVPGCSAWAAEVALRLLGPPRSTP